MLRLALPTSGSDGVRVHCERIARSTSPPEADTGREQGMACSLPTNSTTENLSQTGEKSGARREYCSVLCLFHMGDTIANESGADQQSLD